MNEQNRIRHGRKTEYVVVPGEWGARDTGKTYKITEAPAAQACWWADRFMLLFTGSGYAVPMGLAGRGWEALAIIGWNTLMAARLRSEELKPLLDELMTCVEIVRDPRAIDPTTGEPVAHKMISPDDVEEVKTIYWLRGEVARVHMGFSPFDVLSGFLVSVTTPVSETM